jgi:SAM-dependent methyltransferase
MTLETTLPLDVLPYSTPDRWNRPYLDLLLISFLILFFELACIRFFGSTVVFLTFFTNIVLMACFLGMSVGCMTAKRRSNFIEMVLPLLFMSAMLALVTFMEYKKQNSALVIDVGNQTSPQLIYFGTEYRAKDPSKFVIPIDFVAGVFFVMIAMIFVGLGQVMGRAFDAIPSRIGAYTTNVFGSLLGIVAFFAASWFKTSPHIWFLVCIVMTLYFVPRWSGLQIVSQIGALFVIAMVSYGVVESGQVLWSPYYKIRYVAQQGGIDTNNISHQQMVNVLTAGPAYMLPHLLNRDAGGKPFDNVMIIGAGSGNDVAAALANGAGHIDAVEIDPVINQRGKEDHPNQPFQDPRVKIWYDDGRSFLHKDHGPYDLEVYALVDSLVLHSGFSSLRLENFLFTEQAFRDVKAKLKPGGVFAMYNYYRQGWVVARLATMAKNVFGMDPIVISLPYQETISQTDNQANHITFLLMGVPDASGKNPAIEAIREKFKNNTFWLNTNPSKNAKFNGFLSNDPQHGAVFDTFTYEGVEGFQKIAPAQVDTTDVNLYPTDNWPFLYLKAKEIPFKPNQMGIYVVGGLSILVMLLFTWPVWFGNAGIRARPNGQMFFLGAGFMLLETKGVVHMALLFGSTWIVNSVVFFAILVMILLANLFVISLKPRKLLVYYALLVAALLVNTFVPMDRFLALSGAARTIVSCSVIFVPIFFAGVIFAASFRDSTSPDIDMGSNIAGVILGGLSENLSMVLGFNYLLGVAIVFYLLSWVLKRKLAPVLWESAGLSS